MLSSRHITEQAICYLFDTVTTDPSPIRVERSRDWLPTLLQQIGAERGAEIGVYQGVFSEAFCKANPGLDLLCVDPWRHVGRRPKKGKDLEAAYLEASRRLAPYGCRLYRGLSLDAAREVPDASLDFVYIDADHTAAAVRADLEAWTPKVRSGGVVAGHDMWAPRGRRLQEVKRAVKAYTKRHAIQPWWILAGDLKPSFLWVKA